MKAQQIINELKSYASEDRRKTNEWFFKTGEGEYSEHDRFIGVRVPHTRQVAKKHFQSISKAQLSELLASPIHEIRHLGLIILVNQYQAGDQDRVFGDYLSHLEAVNNWDLVDTSAPQIVGHYLHQHPEQQALLFDWVKDNSLWKRRIAIVATLTLIKHQEFTPTLRLAKHLLGDSQDLIHKAVGWMLREIYKQEPEVCLGFIRENYAQLPRTTLRYAIERLEESERKRYLIGDF